MANHIITLYDRAVSCDKRLLEQWDKERNGSLTPKDVSAFSHGKAWWLCEKGHSWEAVIASRSRGVGCPVCAGLKILEGYNDLQTRLPELAAEWHPTKNGSLRPTMVARNSHKKVWWQCEKGHEWEATIKSRSTGSGCPVCRNRTVVAGENDLASQAPDIAAQWHPQKNAPITPDQVTAGSQKCVWWLCEHGHEWQARICERTNRRKGCPHCAHRPILIPAGEKNSRLIGEWHPTKNGTLKPEDISECSSRAVWWRCAKGHEWQAKVSNQYQESSCPFCAGKRILSGENDLKTLYPAITLEWHPTKNDPLQPENVAPHSNRYVWWQCPLGHEYYMMVNSRTQRGSGCPYCAGSKVLAGFNDLATRAPKVAAQWYTPLNGDLTPQDVVAGSNKFAWWQCQEGHVWRARISARTRQKGTGCPYCARNMPKKRSRKDRR